MSDVSSSSKIQTVTGPLEPARDTVRTTTCGSRRCPVRPPGLPVLDQEGDRRRARRLPPGRRRYSTASRGQAAGEMGALRRLSRPAADIVASTGYHLRKYYPQDYWLFGASR